MEFGAPPERRSGKKYFRLHNTDSTVANEIFLSISNQLSKCEARRHLSTVLRFSPPKQSDTLQFLDGDFPVGVRYPVSTSRTYGTTLLLFQAQHASLPRSIHYRRLFLHHHNTTGRCSWRLGGGTTTAPYTQGPPSFSPRHGLGRSSNSGRGGYRRSRP